MLPLPVQFLLFKTSCGCEGTHKLFTSELLYVYHKPFCRHRVIPRFAALIVGTWHSDTDIYTFILWLFYCAIGLHVLNKLEWAWLAWNWYHQLYFHITSKTTLEKVGKSSNSQANHTLYIQSIKILKIMKEMWKFQNRKIFYNLNNFTPT